MTDPFDLSKSARDLPAIPENRWIGRLTSIEMERGITAKGPRQGVPYLHYTVQGRDGMSRARFFSTFSRTFGETACNALKQNKDVQLDFKPDPRGPAITDIQIIEPEDQEQEGENDGSSGR